MLEEEVFGVLTDIQYKKFMAKFEKEFGPAKTKKRITISYWDPEVDKNFDPKLRVTNGKAELMVKHGEWENLEIQKINETNFDIASTLENVMSCLDFLELSYCTENTPNVQQYDNYIWETETFELKLGKQFNNVNTKYIFEVEILDKSKSLNKIVKELGLSEHTLKTDLAFWDVWNKEVNLRYKDLSEGERRELIEEYIK